MTPKTAFSVIWIGALSMTGCSGQKDLPSLSPSSLSTQVSDGGAGSGSSEGVIPQSSIAGSNAPSLPTPQAFVESQVVAINALNEQPQYALMNEDLELLKSENLLNAEESEKLARLAGSAPPK